MAWTGKEHGFAAAIAASSETWGTEQSLAAGDGIKVAEGNMPFGEQSAKVEETTDNGWPQYVDFGNVENLDFSMDFEPRFCSSTSKSPMDEMLFACLASGTTATQQAATAAYLHTQTIASNKSLADTVSRWFTLASKWAKTSGSSYLSIPSWQPSGFEWVSEAGQPVKVSVKGIGNKVLRDSATISGSWSNVTYLDTSRKVFHHHIGSTGCWLAASAAVGASPVTFGTGQAVQPSKLSISLDRKHEAVYTTQKYSDQPSDNGFTEIKVSITFPQYTDANETLLDAALKSWESGTETYFHLRTRWTFGTVIASTYYPYYEIGLPMLMPTSVKRDTSAGKRVEHTVEFIGLTPTAYAHLPTCFQYAGGASGASIDAMYLAVMNQTTAALIA
ncbi:MAG: hypothetical protein ACOZEN_06850 [Thermodesulfobacteriota bacterium]